MVPPAWQAGIFCKPNEIIQSGSFETKIAGIIEGPIPTLDLGFGLYLDWIWDFGLGLGLDSYLSKLILFVVPIPKSNI